jgi:hypothetical protein
MSLVKRSATPRIFGKSVGIREDLRLSEPFPLSLRAYRLLSAAAAPLAPKLLARRLKRGREHPLRLAERYGQSNVPRPPGPLIWVHGASVGELIAVVPLIERLRGKGFAVLCTSGTVSSASVAEQRLPKAVIHQFVPLDVPRFVQRFYDHWRPELALFVESDLWPNLSAASRSSCSTAGSPSSRSIAGGSFPAPLRRCCDVSIFAWRNRLHMRRGCAISARRA